MFLFCRFVVYLFIFSFFVVSTLSFELKLPTFLFVFYVFSCRIFILCLFIYCFLVVSFDKSHVFMCFFFFFFKQKPAYELRISYWSSDFCSSDLARPASNSRFARTSPSASLGESGRLTQLIREELSIPVDPRVAAMAAAIAAEYPGSARSVLFYGSCLRETQLDGLMLDFYLIVSDYGDAYPRRWLAFANRLIPPNVFPFQHGGLVAKYAVLSEGDFHRLNGPATRNISVWARFAQDRKSTRLHSSH